MSYLKNYTTKIKAFKTISEIESILASNGARAIMKDFDTDGQINLIYFMIETKQGNITYKLPCDYKRVNQVLIRLQKTKKISLSVYKAQDIDHAINVGWRIVKDWLAAQLSLIIIEMASLEEIFLPYALYPGTKQTFFEKMKETNYSLLLEDGK